MNQPKRLIVLGCCVGVMLSGCANSTNSISTSYISPLQYKAHDCIQLNAEAHRVQSRVAALGGQLDQAATNDKVIMVFGMVIFWPVLFALGGNKAQEAEYARLKGEYGAVQISSGEHRCIVTG